MAAKLTHSYFLGSQKNHEEMLWRIPPPSKYIYILFFTSMLAHHLVLCCSQFKKKLLYEIYILQSPKQNMQLIIEQNNHIFLFVSIV